MATTAITFTNGKQRTHSKRNAKSRPRNILPSRAVRSAFKPERQFPIGKLRIFNRTEWKRLEYMRKKQHTPRVEKASTCSSGIGLAGLSRLVSWVDWRHCSLLPLEI